MEKEKIYSKENIKKVLLSKGIEIDARPYYVNLIGIRNREGRVNYFDDTLVTMVYKPNGCEVNYYNITTEPGLFYLKQPINSKGTAIVKEGHYPKVWRSGLHKGHPALIQVGNFTIWRDNDKDGEIDMGSNEETGNWQRIDLHGRYNTMGDADSNPMINKFSAGCQVFDRNADLEKVLAMCRISDQMKNGDFNYTLLSNSDFEKL